MAWRVHSRAHARRQAVGTSHKGSTLTKANKVSLSLVALGALLPACGAGPEGEPGAETGSAEPPGSRASSTAPDAELARPDTPLGTSSDTGLTTARKIAPAELSRMQDFVANRLNGTVIANTLYTRLGRQVHCVEIESQPGLRGEALEAPPADLDPVTPAHADEELALGETLNDGAGNAASCASGTVPIPEVTLADVRRFSTLNDFFGKWHDTRLGLASDESARGVPLLSGEAMAPRTGSTKKYQYAHYYRNVTNWGAETYINIWNPATNTNEHSIAQIWVSGGSGTGLQTLEAGINHDKALYNDESVHLFIYSTRDGYDDDDDTVASGCYNNSCGDFVQTNNTYYPGQTLTPSVDGGTQRAIRLHWAKAGDSGSWWLSVNDTYIGYYPRSLFTAVKNRAATIDFGGEITNKTSTGKHTTTDMGSGKPPSAGWSHTAYMRKIRYNDSNPSGSSITWAEATGLSRAVTDAQCYDASYTESSDPNWMTYLYQGGTGYSTNCK